MALRVACFGAAWHLGVGAAFVVGALGAGVAYATTRPARHPLAPGTARLVPGDAAVTVHRGSPTAAADAPLRSGDALTVARGTAIVQTSAGRLLARSGTTINFGDTSPRIVRGDVLGDGNHRSSRRASAANLVVNGVARVRQALSLEVGAYDGATSVRTTNDEYVPSTRCAGLSSPAPAAPRSGRHAPLSLDPSDVWDRQSLGVAIELDAALNERSRGISPASRRHGRRGEVANSCRRCRRGTTSTARRRRRRVKPLLPPNWRRPPSSDDTGLREMLVWRADGASWGLIAYQLGRHQHARGTAGHRRDRRGRATVPTTRAPEPAASATTPTTRRRAPVHACPAPAPSRRPPSTTTTTAPSSVVVDPLGGLVNGVGDVLGGLLGGGR